jgi:hypothetical protein
VKLQEGDLVGGAVVAGRPGDGPGPLLRRDELLSLDGPWAYLVICTEADLENITALRMQREQPHVAVRFMRGDRCYTLDDLFLEWSAVLQFPWYFGWNWPAFDECICDLEWLAADAYILVVKNVVSILRDDHEDRRVFFDVLKNAAAFWLAPNSYETVTDEAGNARLRRPDPVPFRIVFHSEPANEPGAYARLREAGIEPAIRRAS